MRHGLGKMCAITHTPRGGSTSHSRQGRRTGLIPPQPSVTRKILSTPKAQSSAIVDCINGDYGIWIGE